jgi:hypothetical protein
MTARFLLVTGIIGELAIFWRRLRVIRSFTTYTSQPALTSAALSA